MKEELKKSIGTYGALILLGVTGVPLGAAVGLIEALFCRLLLAVTAFRVAHLFLCLPFLAVAGLGDFYHEHKHYHSGSGRPICTAGLHLPPCKKRIPIRRKHQQTILGRCAVHRRIS